MYMHTTVQKFDVIKIKKRYIYIFIIINSICNKIIMASFSLVMLFVLSIKLSSSEKGIIDRMLRV